LKHETTFDALRHYNSPRPVPEVRFVYKIIHEVWKDTLRISNTELPAVYYSSDAAHAGIMAIRMRFCANANDVGLATWVDGDGTEVFQCAKDEVYWIQSWVEKFRITKDIVFEGGHERHRGEGRVGKQALSPWFIG